jgi:zona occludens toxin
MLIIVTGETGNGKTAHVVDMLAHDLQFKGRPLFISGIPELKIEHQKCPPVDEWTKEEPNPDDISETLQWFTFPPGALLVVDEAQRMFRPRTVGSKVPPITQALETHRRTGIDIILITQHVGLLDSNCRKHCKRHIHLADTFLGRYRYEWMGVGEPADRSSRQLANRSRYKLPERSFSLYKSAEVHNTIRKPVPLVAYVVGVAAVLLGVSVFFIYNRIAGRGEAAEVKQASSVPAAPPSSFNRSGNIKQTKQQYLDDMIPRLPGVAHTAPRYDQVAMVSDAPYIVGCIKTAKSCMCFDQQSGQYESDSNSCNAWLNGYRFRDWKAVEQGQPTLVSRAGVPK